MRHEGALTHPVWWKQRKAPNERLGILAARYRKGNDDEVASALVWACGEYDLAERRLRVLRAEWERRKAMLREEHDDKYDEAIARVDEQVKRILRERGKLA